MKYFVTGATGFVGSELVRQLRGARHDVVALVRSPDRAGELTRLGVTPQRGDLDDRAALRQGMTGADGVFHVAGWYKLGSSDHRAAQRINVEGTRNVLEMMRDLGIARGVFTSTLAVHSDTHGQVVDEAYRFTGRHVTEYDRTKWLAHYEVALPMMRAGLPLVIVQPGVVYGPGDNSLVRETLVQFLRGKLHVIPGRTAYCWAHVVDIAGGHILAIERGTPGECYHLAGPVHTLVEVMQLASRVANIPSPRTVSPAILRILAMLLRPLTRILPSSIHPETLRAFAGVTYLGDSQKAQRELGFQARSLKEGLTATILHEMSLLAGR
jgi:nucleoside-diphosphate-sugar epimerase